MCKRCEWEKHTANAGEIIDKLDDLPEAATEFGEGVGERLRGIIDWAEKHKHITEPMIQAITNIGDGVDKWLR